MKGIVCIFSMLFCCGLMANMREHTIILPLNDWESQQLLTKIVGNKIVELGFNVEYLPISSVDQVAALKRGIIHLQIEMWQSHKTGDIAEAIDSGQIIEIGLHSAIGREDWWYPTYVKERCEGLPYWEALNNCALLFAGDSNKSKGIFYTGPWNYRDANLIHALNLNFNIVRLNDGKQIWQKLIEANQIKRPIVLLNWSPNWIDVRFSGEFVEFPLFEEECESNPNWGLNKTLSDDCGNPQVTYIKKIAWVGLRSKWPCIYELITHIDFSNEMIAEASALYGYDGYSEKKSDRIMVRKIFKRK